MIKGETMIEAYEWSVKTPSQMIQVIQQEINLTSGSTGILTLSEAVKTAMLKVPRHIFVEEQYKIASYENQALPISNGQTISQPFIVALMTQFLQPEKNHKVLEIGTGSGYQAAILAELVNEVYTIEVIPQLALKAQQCLKQLAYKNIYFLIKNGNEGWEEYAPYEGIIVTAAAKEAPASLLKQLKSPGRMIIPLGTAEGPQMLTLVVKDSQGSIFYHPVLPVQFVPFKPSSSSINNK